MKNRLLRQSIFIFYSLMKTNIKTLRFFKS